MLVPCLECGKNISSKAKACPHCGKPLDGAEWKDHCDKIEFRRFNEAANREMWGCLAYVAAFVCLLAWGVWSLWRRFFQ